MKFGYFLATEEFDPKDLISQAALAQEHGFESLWISDHFHPWTGAQGNSPLVWSVIGALSQVTQLPVTTAVTCPISRIHPAIVAQAAATSAVMLDGRFALGVGTGEALNEHVLGEAWPPAAIRRDMLVEAIEVMRMLWTGDVINHHGRFYTVESARLYTLPQSSIPVYISGFGPQATSLAGQAGDGYMTMSPDAKAIETFNANGGQGKPTQAGCKVCWAPTKAEAIELAWQRWSNMALPGELGQVLPSPQHFEQAASLVTREAIAETFACGPDPAEHIAALAEYARAGYDEVYVANIGPYQREFFAFYRDEVLPQIRAGSTSASPPSPAPDSKVYDGE